MSTLNIKSFMEVAKITAAWRSILIRGETGIGKDFITLDLAKFFGLKAIDRRLSQLTEGDVIGLPDKDGEDVPKEQRCTRFLPPDWFMEACREPRLLFLNELNRATNEVMQAAFQIVLDRELNGHKLHPETRVYVAINIGGKYIVNEFDSALLRRFAVVDLAPTPQEWIDWARTRKDIPTVVVDYIAANEKFLDPAKEADPGVVQPTRAGWHMLARLLVEGGLFKGGVPLCKDPRFENMCKMNVGLEASMSFTQFCRTYEVQVTGDDLLNRYEEVRDRIPELGQEAHNVCIERLVTYIEKNVERFTDAQGKNVRAFLLDIPAELRVDAWSKITQRGTQKLEIAKSIHPHVVDLMTGVFGVPVGQDGVGTSPKIPHTLVDTKEDKKS